MRDSERRRVRGRQLGTDRGTTPQPAAHPAPSAWRLARARSAPAVCVLLWGFYIVTVVVTLARGEMLSDAGQLLQTLAFLVSVTLLTFSACMYLLARAAALPRFASHRRTRRRALDEHVAATASRAPGPAPRLVALLPSRSEDPELVRMSLWSVALQEFEDLHVVLLIDDDPDPLEPDARRALTASRLLTAQIAAELEPMRRSLDTASAELRALSAGLHPDGTSVSATALIVREHVRAADWLRSRVALVPGEGHVEAFFANEVLGGLARDLDATAIALRDALDDGEEPLSRRRAEQVLRRLVNIFGATLSTFERKRYTSFSHAPNKAMNLNSYLGIMGGRYREERDRRGLRLVPLAPDEPVGDDTQLIAAPDSEYVLTLDADSMLLPEYCLRLVHLLDRPEHARTAVAQTPYSAYRGAPTRLERLAGATTDLQHIVHQGLTGFGATFWVGANAVLRRAALEDIRTESDEDGVRVVRFISDRTVIEDTESSIDIAAHGWQLHNYPERLSYSATPPDFGSLVIQRRRWADGGLLILPALVDLVVSRRRAGRPLRVSEVLLRANYLGSITWVTLGLLAVLTLNPLGGQLVTLQLLLIALPYFVEMASDLKMLGYRRRDVIGMYGLNLLLLPVNLAGSVASILQVLTGRKAVFARTPKVSSRTPAPALAVLAPLVFAAAATVVAVRAGTVLDWGTTAFAGFTALAALGAVVSLVGVRSALSDLWFGWLNWLWVEARQPDPEPEPVAPRWAGVVDDGLLSIATVR